MKRSINLEPELDEATKEELLRIERQYLADIAAEYTKEDAWLRRLNALQALAQKLGWSDED